MSTSSTTIAILALLGLPGIGRKRALSILDRPLEATDLDCSRDEFVGWVMRRWHREISRDSLLDAWGSGEEQASRCQYLGVEIVSIYDESYPSRLRNIPDPPAVLFTLGHAKSLGSHKSIAIVGTRKPTPFGQTSAYNYAYVAVDHEFTVVSGLAVGCDAHAHRGCTDARGIGVAVLAHGLDRIYPSCNQNLADKLLEEGGCLVSEYPIGVRPSRGAFVERDRLQSGLADGVLVVETTADGGTMHTVRHAGRQLRRVACVQHPCGYQPEDAIVGNRMLIEQGQVSPIANDDAYLSFLGGMHELGQSEMIGPLWSDTSLGEHTPH